MTEPLDPGLLRHRVGLERPQGTSDGSGGETIAWTPVATLWARIDPIGATESAIAGHLTTMATHKITIRWRDDVVGGMRIVFRGRHFRVRAVFDPDERQRYLVLATEEERR
jgi:SPP1 family predicted phage head-tail adaptor